MINLKQNLKLAGVAVLSLCAVFVCTIFLNYSIDLKGIRELISGEYALAVYEGQLTVSKIIIACCGTVLGAVTLFVLLFAIGGYINASRESMGVLKALGYSDAKISLRFIKFGLSVFIGTGFGYLAGFLISPVFYGALDSSNALPEVARMFHFEVLLIMVIAPTVLFSAVSVFYALIKLRKPPLAMISGTKTSKTGRLAKKLQSSDKDVPFLKNLRKAALFNNLALMFFVGFAAFAFSAQLQMAFFMTKPVFMALFISLALILGTLTLFIALSFVINSNKKYLALMKAYGYTGAECYKAMLGGYRIVSFIGFIIGTVYQFFLINLIISVFAATGEMEAISFDYLAFFITLASFIALYELIMLYYKRKINLIPLKEIMQA